KGGLNVKRAARRPPGETGGVEIFSIGMVEKTSNSIDPVQSGQARPPIEPLLGIADLAEVLRCSRRLVERMRSAGQLPQPTLHVGRCPRWTAAVVRDWIAGGGRL